MHFQADIDAAFRRIPVAPQHRWACWVAFLAMGQASYLHAGRVSS